MSKRNPGTLGVWGADGTRVVASEAMWRKPLKWDLEASDQESLFAATRNDSPPRPRVFCGSLCDVFEDWEGECLDHSGCALYTRDDDPTNIVRSKVMVGCLIDGFHYTTLADVRRRLFATIDATPNLDWLLLTKRPENIRRMVTPYWSDEDGAPVDLTKSGPWGPGIVPRRNVWLGTSVACQEDAERNVPELLRCRDMAAKLFLSVEPLIGPVDLSRVPVGNGWCVDALNGYWTTDVQRGPDTFEQGQCEQGPAIDWVIVGGESGPNARPCAVEWIRSIVDQCRAAGVPVFVKQDYGPRPGLQGRIPDDLWTVKEIPDASRS